MGKLITLIFSSSFLDNSFSQKEEVPITIECSFMSNISTHSLVYLSIHQEDYTSEFPCS